MDETAHGRTWEDETLELIRRLEEDRLKKAEQRLAAAQRAVSSVRGQIDALHVALEVYRNEHGIARAEVEPPDAKQVAEFQGLSVKGMLYRWADQHDGRVVMRDATKFLAAIGLFRDETQAAGALYPAIGRAEEDFEKVGRGVYQRKAWEAGEPDEAPMPPEQHDATSELPNTQPAVVPRYADGGVVQWSDFTDRETVSTLAVSAT